MSSSQLTPSFFRLGWLNHQAEKVIHGNTAEITVFKWPTFLRYSGAGNFQLWEVDQKAVEGPSSQVNNPTTTKEKSEQLSGELSLVVDVQ